MAKQTRKTVSISSLVVDKAVNVRLAQNYDIPAMVAAILTEGRILDPIHVRQSDMVVLRGNRRTLAGQQLLADKECPQEVADNLKKVDVVLHDVAPGSLDEMNVILDHGNTKTLSRTEVLLTVWRLDKQFMSESQIIVALYQSLAAYTGNQQKAIQAASMSNQRERGEFLRKWLHGTVGNYFLAANKMGEYVREQMRLTHLSEDRLLPEGVKVEMRINRDRITALSAAKSKDDPKNGGKGWSPETGGEAFNAKIEEFKAEDAGVPVEKKKRPTVRDLMERADIFKSPAIRTALQVAAGESEKANGLVDLDARLFDLHLKLEVLQKASNGIKDANVKALVEAMFKDGPAAGVELALRPFVA